MTYGSRYARRNTTGGTTTFFTSSTWGRVGRVGVSTRSIAVCSTALTSPLAQYVLLYTRELMSLSNRKGSSGANKGGAGREVPVCTRVRNNHEHIRPPNGCARPHIPSSRQWMTRLKLESGELPRLLCFSSSAYHADLSYLWVRWREV